MKYAYLGKTGLRVSVLSYGVYSLTGMYGEVGVDEALRILRFTRELGINFYDTADVYGRGLGEEIIRRAFQGDEDLIVATKVGYDFYSSPERPVRVFSEDYIVKAAYMSSKRLGRRPIHLLQIHNPTLESLKEGSIYRAGRRLLREGVISHFGIALGPEIDVLDHAEEALSHDEVETLQFVCNMLELEPGLTIAREARKMGVGTIVRVPHAGGVLDETIKPGEEAGLADHRSLRRPGWYKWAFETYARIRRALSPYEGTPGQKALKFLMQLANPDTVVLIAKSARTLEDYIGSLNISDLPVEALRSITKIYEESLSTNPEAPHSALKRLKA